MTGPETDATSTPRGVEYPGDRTALAYVYDGLDLRAVLYDEREIERYREQTSLTLRLTPAGGRRLGRGDP